MNVNISHKLHVDCQAESPSGLGAQSALIDWLMDGRLTGWLADWRTDGLLDSRTDCRTFRFIWIFREFFLSGCQAAGIDISFEPSQRQLAPFASCWQTVVPLKKRQQHQYIHTLHRAQRATVVNSRKLLLTAPVWVSETLVARNPHVPCTAFSTCLVPGQHTSGYLNARTSPQAGAAAAAAFISVFLRLFALKCLFRFTTFYKFARRVSFCLPTFWGCRAAWLPVPHYVYAA